jgi:hypothetical protein
MPKIFQYLQGVATILAFTGILMLLGDFNHFAAFGVVFVSNLIFFRLTLKPQVDQININFKDDLGVGPDIIGMIPKIMISLNWQPNGKRIFADNFNRIEKAVRLPANLDVQGLRV